MNYLRLSLIAGALTLVLAFPAFGGHMDTPVMSPPPPPPPVTGEMGFPGISTDPVMEIALSLVQSVLALF
jgi:hypothetical protein